MAKRAMTKEAKEAKASAILDKAEEMFLSTEYNKIKMSDIASALGISNGILFVYFPTKETLFLGLLRREYEKRINSLIFLADKNKPADFCGVKQMILMELSDLVDNNPLYIKLEAMRAAVLEKNIDAQVMLGFKTELYEKTMSACDMLSRFCMVPADIFLDIFMAELSIITGCKLSAEIPQSVKIIIEDNHLEGFKKDFKTDVLKTMSLYLDGYEISLNKPINLMQ